MRTMRTSTVLFSICFAFSLLAIAQGDTDASGSRTIQDLRKMVRRNGGCKINLCFALDGSNSVTPNEFAAQRRIVSLITRVITVDDSARVAAVQYGTKNVAISPLTNMVEDFLKKVKGARRSGSERTSISAGILYCGDQIRKLPDDSNKMLLLGDGSNNLGSDPIDRGNVFRKLGGEIFGVAIGDANLKLLKRVVQDPDNLLRFSSKDNEKAVIDLVHSVVRGVCGIDDVLVESPSA